VRGFLKRHLPAARLLNNEDNIGKFSLPLYPKGKKKKYNLNRPKRKKLLNKERKQNKVFAIPKQNQRYSETNLLCGSVIIVDCGCQT
jgi:hypothetical protein